MSSITRVTPLLALLFALALPGCGHRAMSEPSTVVKPDLPNAKDIEKCLPDGVSLDSLTTDIHGGEGTVAQELARLKATVKDKALVDKSGREIRFYTPQEDGRAMRSEPKYRELSAKYTVVLLMGE